MKQLLFDFEKLVSRQHEGMLGRTMRWALIGEYVSNAPSNILITDWEVFLLMENSLLIATIMPTSRATLNLLWMGVMSWMVQALRMIPPEYAWIPRR